LICENFPKKSNEPLLLSRSFIGSFAEVLACFLWFEQDITVFMLATITGVSKYSTLAVVIDRTQIQYRVRRRNQPPG